PLWSRSSRRWVVTLLARNKWPFRLHATYDQSITRALDVYEAVNRDVPLNGLHWFIDHAETISKRSIERIAALGGGIAIQHRMAYQGEYFPRSIWGGGSVMDATDSRNAQFRFASRSWDRCHHSFWESAGTPAFMGQLINFSKNLAMLGGLL